MNRIREITVPDDLNVPIKITRGPDTEQKSVSNLMRLLASNSLGLFQPGTYENYIWTHNAHVWVYRCTRVLVNAAIRVRPKQVREYVQNKIEKQEPLPYDHPAVTILQNPNFDDTAAKLIEKIIVSWNLTGIYYLAYEPTVHELHHLRSDRVTINPDPRKYIRDFTYSVWGESTTFPRDAIVYDKYYNPNNDYYGLSPLQAATNSINSHMRAQKWNLNYFINSAIPAGLLTTDYHFENQDQLDLYKKHWQQLYGGYEKAGSIAVLGDGLKYDAVTPSHSDMNFTELLDKSRDEIFAAFSVPRIFANASEAENYSNLQGYLRMLWYGKLIPDFIQIGQALDKYLNPRFAEKGERIRTLFDYSAVEELREDIVKEAEASRVLVTSFQRTPNQARERRGEPPAEGGDVLLGPLSMCRLDQIGAVLDGRTPATGERPQKPQKAIVHKSILKSREERVRHWMKTKSIVEDNERKLLRVLVAIFTDWEEEMLAKLGASKVVEKTIDVETILFDVETGKEMLTRSGGPILEDSVEKGGKRVLAKIDSSVSFDITDPRVEEIMQSAKQRFAEEIATPHWERMKASLSEGIHNGENSRQLAERVRETMGHEINNAPTVARTEINPAYQEGQLEGMRQSGVVIGKEWLAAFTANSRDDHLSADGQKVALDDYFVVGGEPLRYPGDPSGSASNIINCLCDELPVLEGETL